MPVKTEISRAKSIQSDWGDNTSNIPKNLPLLNIGIKFILFIFFILLFVIIFVKWTMHVFEKEYDRVHPNEVQVRDWIKQVGGSYSNGYRIDPNRHIIVVDLNGTKINDNDLKRLIVLKKLKALNLNNTNITDEAIPIINEMKTLIDIQVNGTKITNEGWKKLMLIIDNNYSGHGHCSTAILPLKHETPKLKKINVCFCKQME
jgi:hypothetical protein